MKETYVFFLFIFLKKKTKKYDQIMLKITIQCFLLHSSIIYYTPNYFSSTYFTFISSLLPASFPHSGGR